MGEEAVKKPGEWRAGWPVVLASAFGVSIGTIHIYSTSLFIQPLEQEFGWSRTAIGAGVTITAVLGVMFAPLFGYFVDRFGPRRIALTGVVVYCSAIALLSQTGSAVWNWLALWFLVGIGTTFLKPTVWSSAVTSMFTRHRGVAIALMLSGTGVGAALVPTITNKLIEQFGWRGAYVGLGGLFALIVLPVLFFFFRDARDRDTSRSRAEQARDLPGWTVAQGLRKRQFYQINIAGFLATGVIVGYLIHFVSILQATGLSREQAVGLSGLIGIMSISARLLVGFLFDRTSNPLVGAISLGLPMIPAVLLLALPGSLPAAAAAVIVLGLAIGGEYDAVIYLSSRHFGMRNFGTLFGFIASGFLAGVGLGPIVAGSIYDATGGYTLFLWIVIPLSLAAALLVGTLGAYRFAVVICARHHAVPQHAAVRREQADEVVPLLVVHEPAIARLELLDLLDRDEIVQGHRLSQPPCRGRRLPPAILFPRKLGRHQEVVKGTGPCRFIDIDAATRLAVCTCSSVVSTRYRQISACNSGIWPSIPKTRPSSVRTPN